MKTTPLQRFMDEVGVKDRAVATAAKVDFKTVYRIRKGICRPSSRVARKLADWARVTARRQRIPERRHLTLDDLVGR